MANDNVLVNKKDGICTITMNRPQAMNALNGDLLMGLAEAFQECYDDAIRAVVLTGTGKAFCLGGDIAWASTYGDERYAPASQTYSGFGERHLRRCWSQLRFGL